MKFKVRLRTIEGFEKTVELEPANIFKRQGHTVVMLLRLSPEIFRPVLKNAEFSSVFIRSRRRYRGLPVFVEDRKDYALD